MLTKCSQTPLPLGMELSCVGSGYVVVRCKGLYEAKLTLVPTLPVPPNLEPSSPKAGVLCCLVFFRRDACLKKGGN